MERNQDLFTQLSHVFLVSYTPWFAGIPQCTRSLLWWKPDENEEIKEDEEPNTTLPDTVPSILINKEREEIL